MQSRDVRQSFIDFFAGRGHLHAPSSPLVPHGDPTLLFTNAGMVQFKDYFLGRETPPAKRAVTAQKCLRVSGKHNDLENVGPSPRHHTFFEMLGNFSFGDYFKAAAIEYGWDLVTRVWGLSPAVLAATVFEQDDEAAELWRKISGLPPERIHRCGAKDNFWAMGDTGPCGPCSEIYVDLHPGRPAVGWEEGTESGRYLEIWNLVFMQFDRAADGTMTPLPNPSIDTGAGLERVTAVLQGVPSNYDTDLFRPILAATAELSQVPYGRDERCDVAMRVIADHLRAVSFLLADGVIPSNEGRGYVLRRILRRAVRHGMHLGFEEPFLHRLVPVLDEAMGGFYRELAAARAATVTTVRAEEEKFLATVASGARQVQEAIDRARREGSSVLPGAAVFALYDTHGLPLEVVREIAEEERFSVDQEGFGAALAEQRKRSREVTAGSQRDATALQGVLAGLPPTEFVGYERLRVEGARVLAALPQAAGKTGGGFDVEPAIAAPGSGVVVVSTTPMYAEAGGQVGDQGEILWAGGRAVVDDTRKLANGVVYHYVRVLEGRLERGTSVTVEVGESLRRDTERNHTATHLLHAALREVFGEGVRQAGSLVHPERLRFDFTCGRPLSREELARVEDLVNERVRQAVDTRIVVQGYPEAVARGAMALFGEKYGDRVRTVEVPGFSLELCGGCHVRNTGEIGTFLVTAERGIASGVRRVEALTGRGASAHLRQQQQLAAALEQALGVPLERAADEARALHERLRAGERELARSRRQLATGGSAAGEEAREVAGVKVLTREVPLAPPDQLRDIADALRQKLGSGVVVLGARGEGKVTLVAAVTGDLVGRVHAGNLVKATASVVGGSGGGRPDFAQAGGKAPDQLPAALAAAYDEVARQLAGVP